KPVIKRHLVRAQSGGSFWAGNGEYFTAGCTLTPTGCAGDGFFDGEGDAAPPVVRATAWAERVKQDVVTVFSDNIVTIFSNPVLGGCALFTFPVIGSSHSFCYWHCVTIVSAAEVPAPE